MPTLLRTLLHYCRRLLVLKFISVLIPKDPNLILFSSWFGMKYADNSMYLYEYMLDNSHYKVVWFTRSRDVYELLKSANKPVIYSKSVAAVLYHLRAKTFISTVQFNDFISALMANCVLLDLDHGFPAKYVHFVSPTITKREIQYERILRKFVTYYMTASSTFTMEVVSKCFDIPKERMIFSNKPRVDVFFNEALRKGKNLIVDKIKGNKRAIVWMPTHRSQGCVEINVKELIDLDAIQDLCEKIDAVFIIKKHFYHSKEITDLSMYSRVFDLTQENLEVQTLLYQADVLISDYSSCYIEYLTMNRPVILYVFDLEHYLQTERDVCVKMEDNHVGYKVKTKQELSSCLRLIGQDWTDLANEEGRKEAIARYFDSKVEMGESCKVISELLPSIIKGDYSPNWN